MLRYFLLLFTCASAFGQAFTFTDLAFLGQGSITNLTNGLIGWWKFDEATINGGANSLADSSGSGFNASPNFSSTNLDITTHGKVNNAVVWNNGLITSYVGMGNHPSLQTRPFTQMAWICPSNISSSHMVFAGLANANPATLISGPNSGRLELWVDVFGPMIGNSTVNMANNTWKHVAVSYDVAGNWKFWVNGSPAGSGLNNQTTSTGEFDVGVGAGGTELTFFGIIDEVRVYNRVLTDGDMSYLVHQYYGQ